MGYLEDEGIGKRSDKVSEVSDAEASSQPMIDLKAVDPNKHKAFSVGWKVIIFLVVIAGIATASSMYGPALFENRGNNIEDEILAMDANITDYTYETVESGVIKGQKLEFTRKCEVDRISEVAHCKASVQGQNIDFYYDKNNQYFQENGQWFKGLGNKFVYDPMNVAVLYVDGGSIHIKGSGTTAEGREIYKMGSEGVDRAFQVMFTNMASGSDIESFNFDIMVYADDYSVRSISTYLESKSQNGDIELDQKYKITSINQGTTVTIPSAAFSGTQIS